MISSNEINYKDRNGFMTPLSTTIKIRNLKRSYSVIQNEKTKNKQRLDMRESLISTFKKKYQKINQQIQQNISEFETPYFTEKNIHKQKIQALKYDPQIIAFKLKQLENNAQLGRLNMQLAQRQMLKNKQYDIENPLRNNTSKKNKRQISLRNKININKKGANNYLGKKSLMYKDQYKNMNLSAFQINENNEESQYQPQQSNPQSIIMNGLRHYQQLKKRPKFLGFLMKKINSSYMRPQHIQYTNQMQYNFKSMKLGDYIQTAKSSLYRHNSSEILTPQKIIQQQYPKFFSRHDVSLPQSIINQKRCQKLIKQQNSIIKNANTQLSKQSKRKLKQKLNQIVIQISQSQRYNTPTKLQKKKYDKNQIRGVGIK